MSAWTCRHTDGKAVPKIVPPRLRSQDGRALAPDSEEKHEPVSDIDTVLVDSLKALDSKRPIREADMEQRRPEPRRIVLPDPRFERSAVTGEPFRHPTA